jgi:tRNA(Ile)-lysidine synthase
MNHADKLTAKFSDYLTENKLVGNGNTILVGFSGGADSTSLLHLFWSVKKKLNITLMAAHVNYNLRGDDSKADMLFCRDFCSEYGIALVVKEVFLDSQKPGIENQARKIRMDYFKELQRLYKIDRISLGHNMEDVAETMLLHLFRGAGIKGLRGIIPKNGDLVRPLICFKREELIKYLEERKITNWRIDTSNADNAYTRNKIRNVIVPYVLEELNPNLTEMLYENSTIFHEADLVIEEYAKKLRKKAIIKQSSREIRLSIPALKKGKRIFLFTLIRSCIKSIVGDDSGFYHRHFNEIESIMVSEGSKIVNLAGGLLVKKEYDELIISSEESSPEQLEGDVESLLEIGKKFQIIANTRFFCQKFNVGEIKQDQFQDSSIALMDLDKITLPLKAGFKSPGDRFIPLGMSGSKKLKDFFIDEKISKFERDRVLIVRDQDKIVWVAGMRLDNRVRISQETKNVLMLKIEDVSPRLRRSAQRKKQN